MPPKYAGVLNEDQRVWVRWLFQECQVPLEHVEHVFELDGAKMTAYLATINRRRRGRYPGALKGPPRCWRPVNPERVGVRGQSGTYIRRLSTLGYQPWQIGVFLGLRPDDVREFLRRLEPLRGRPLKRPRTRAELRQISTPPPKFVPPRVSIPAGWSWRTRPCDEPKTTLPAPIADPELDDQVAAEARGRFVNPSSPNAWDGPESIRLRAPRLDRHQVDRAREMLRRGQTYPSVAKFFGVTVNTVRKYVGDVGPRAKLEKVAPVKLCACGCGKRVKTRDARYATGHGPHRINARECAEVKRLRALGMRSADIATRLDVSVCTVNNIISGRTRVTEDTECVPSPAGAQSAPSNGTLATTVNPGPDQATLDCTSLM
jgi:DNA-binding CsgD family transcriptional regulator